MDHQNLSEHVLCMVLYLIELGLENSPEQESEEEVRRLSEGGEEVLSNESIFNKQKKMFTNFTMCFRIKHFFKAGIS